MTRSGIIICLGIFASLVSGCSMCCSPYDYVYPVFQGNYTRVDSEYGRVGSVFSDPNIGSGELAKTNLDLPQEEPLPLENRQENITPPITDQGTEIELTIPTGDVIYDSGTPHETQMHKTPPSSWR